MLNRLAARIVSIIALVCCATWLGCSSSDSTPIPEVKDCPGCNIVVILIDTLRADHLPMYGYAKNTSPFLSSLAEKGTVFERAFSASSWTAPATASIFTGMYPSQHGVITGFAATKVIQKQGGAIQLNHLPGAAATMAEYMKAAGFTTIGVADNLNIGHEIGFDRGFKHFKKTRNDGAQSVVDQASQFIEEAGTKRPYFLYLHFMDPHRPYEKRKPWFEDCIKSPNNTRRGRMICAYDSEIHYTDKAIESLATKYKWLENSIVVFTADHGEEFWEHGQTGHGHSLYSELLHVPLVMYHPYLQPGRVKENVQTTDILPTLASLTKQPRDKRWKGKNIEGFLYGEKDLNTDREIVSERFGRVELPGPEFRSLIKGSKHFIHTANFDENSTLKKEFFDLKEDFNEQNNLMSVMKEDSARFDKRLSEIPLRDRVAEHEETTSIDLDESLLKQLQSLGYMN